MSHPKRDREAELGWPQVLKALAIYFHIFIIMVWIVGNFAITLKGFSRWAYLDKAIIVTMLCSYLIIICPRRSLSSTRSSRPPSDATLSHSGTARWTAEFACNEAPTVPQISNGYIFFGIAAALFGYILYTMIRKRKGERPGQEQHEPEL